MRVRERSFGPHGEGAAVTFASGVVVAARMTETRKPSEMALSAPPPCVEPSEVAAIPNAVVVDVRSDEEFAAGHIDGAMHIPLDSLAHRASEILITPPGN